MGPLELEGADLVKIEIELFAVRGEVLDAANSILGEVESVQVFEPLGALI